MPHLKFSPKAPKVVEPGLSLRLIWLTDHHYSYNDSFAVYLEKEPEALFQSLQKIKECHHSQLSFSLLHLYIHTYRVG